MDQLFINVQQLQKRIDDMELRTNEEQKNNDMDDKVNQLMKQFESMEQTMHKLSINANLNPEQQEVKLWLKNKCKLGQYYDVFIKNGIDELSVVALLDQSTLKDIGIDIVGHRMRILDQARQLKQNDNDYVAPREGGTAHL